MSLGICIHPWNHCHNQDNEFIVESPFYVALSFLLILQTETEDFVAKLCLPPEQRAVLFTVQYNKITSSGASIGHVYLHLITKAHYKRLKFPKLAIPQLYCRLTVCPASTWTAPCKSWEAKETNANMKVVMFAMP